MAALLALVRFPGGEASRSIIVEERGGTYDLTGIGNWENTVVALPPGETYYPNTYLTPEEADTAIPESADHYGEVRTDYLSQRFHISLPDTGEVYTLIFTAEGRQAMRVYVNGALTGQSGNPGTSKAATQVGANGMVCFAAAQGGQMDVILHIAQFHHYGYTGGVVPATLSLQKSAEGGWSSGTFGLDKQMLVTGALLCASGLLLFIYLLRRDMTGTLYFSLACLMMAVRERIQSVAWLYFPFASGNTAFMLKYLTLPLLTVFLTLYLGQFVEKGLLLRIKHIILAGSVAYALCTLVGDSLFYTQMLIYYQVLLVACIVVGIVGLFVRMRRPSPEQTAALYGIAVFYLAAVWDVFMYSERYASTAKASVSEAAMLVFVLAETISIFLRSNRLIAEAREAEQMIAAEKAALENLNQMKTEFLGNVSHELKTPLTVVSGYAQTTRQLLERPEEIDRREAVRRMELISSEAERLSLMVGQVLDATRIEEGRMGIEPVPCHLDEIIHRAVDTYYPVLNKNANQLEIQVDPGLPPVDADPARVSQVIVNLIANAVRHTQSGSITVTVQSDGAYVKTTVSDTGAGIAEVKLPLLFERYRSQGGGTGTGLGLYICKHIVEMHGGEISVKSVQGKGTSVSFTLPICPA
ncbi:MAG TPA: sensor histidine kinase [Clostridia bacterium]|nr:sensor histidine kinase [Clostridia bacterium]